MAYSNKHNVLTRKLLPHSVLIFASRDAPCGLVTTATTLPAIVVGGCVLDASERTHHSSLLPICKSINPSGQFQELLLIIFCGRRRRRT